MQRILSAVLATGFVTGAAAQEMCEHAPLINEMAQFVLEQRTALPALKQPRFGDTAAFMAIRYGGVDGAALLDGLAQGEGRPPRLLDDLRDAFDISEGDGLAVWQAGGPEVLDRFIGMLPSTRRALILADNGQTYFNLRSNIEANPDLEARIRQADPFGVQPAFVISDQPVEIRMAIAQRAEDAGHLFHAAAILGDMPDRSAFEGLMERHAGNEAFMALDPPKTLGISTIGTLTGDIVLQGPREGNPEGTLRDAQYFAVMKAGLSGAPSDFLNIFVNQSGELELSVAAGQVLLDAVESGDIDPIADPEDAWLILYEALLAQGEADKVQQVLGGFNWPPQSIRSFAGYAKESLDVMVLKDAFGPYVRGETQVFPTPGESFAQTLDWSEWAAVAQVVRSGSAVELAVDQPWIAVELAWEAGRYGQAFEIARAQMEPDEAIQFVRDGMGRLDAICGGSIGVPGGAIRFGGMAVYTFD